MSVYYHHITLLMHIVESSINCSSRTYATSLRCDTTDHLHHVINLIIINLNEWRCHGLHLRPQKCWPVHYVMV